MRLDAPDPLAHAAAVGWDKRGPHRLPAAASPSPQPLEGPSRAPRNRGPRAVAPSRVLRRGRLIVVGACGSDNATATPRRRGSPGPSSATSAAPSAAIAASPATGVSSGDPAWSAILADAVAHAGQPVDDGYVDRTQLLTAMGVPAALGADADAILELVAKGEAAVRAKQPLPAMGSSADVPGGSGIAAAASLAKFQTFESPYLEFRDFITDAPDQIGRDGPQTAHEDLGTQSNTQTAGGRTGTTKQHTVIDVVVSGSVVRVDVQRDIENTVTETATGASGDERDAEAPDQRPDRRLSQRRRPRPGVPGGIDGRGRNDQPRSRRSRRDCRRARRARARARSGAPTTTPRRSAASPRTTTRRRRSTRSADGGNAATTRSPRT